MKKLSWKTSATGVSAIVGGIFTLWSNRHALTESIVTGSIISILTGLGLVAARDNKVTSEEAGAK